MAISREKKAAILDTLKDRLSRQQAVVFVAYRGTNVRDVDALRAAMRAESLDYQVAKKNLLILAAKETIDIEIDPEIFGKVPFATVFGYEDQIASCKISAKYAKEIESIEIIGGIIDGKVVTKEVVMQYASLPSREELLAKFVGLVKAPLSQFQGVLNSGLSGFARALSAYAEKKEA